MNSNEGEGEGMGEQIKVGDLVRVVTVLGPGSEAGCTQARIEPLSHLTDGEWKEATIEAVFRRAAEFKAERDDWKQALDDWKARHAEVLSKAELGLEFERVRQHILGMDSKGGAETVIEASRRHVEVLRAQRDEVTKERDAFRRDRDEWRSDYEVARDRYIEAEAEHNHLLRQWSAIVEAAGIAPMLDDADGSRMTEALIRRLTKPIGAEGPWQAKATAAAAEILRETTTRQPDGYDPGARPEPEKAADPRSWAREGLWTVCEGGYRPGRLLLNRDPWGDGRPSWLLTSTSGEEFGSDLMTRRPATPEEAARFEAELAKNTARPPGCTCAGAPSMCMQCMRTHPGPHVLPNTAPALAHPAQLCVGCKLHMARAVTLLCDACESAVTESDDGLPDGGDPFELGEPEPATIPLAVGQRWVCTVGGKERHEDYDDRIIALGPCEVATRDHDAGGECDTWTHEEFRKRHPRLRDPSELGGA